MRSHDHARVTEVVQQMIDAAAFAASISDCTLETAIEPKYRGYRFRDDDLAVRLAVEALTRTGHTPRLGLSGGAADANVFNGKGLPCVNLANGMTDIHTPDEHIAVDDLERMVDVTLALVDAAARDGLMPLGLRWGTVRPSPSALEGLVRLEVDGDPASPTRGSRARWRRATSCSSTPRRAELELGSGGFDVLYANLTRGLGLPPEDAAHVMALPYAPGQLATRFAEEDDDAPLERIDGLPVVCLGLHSQLAPACAALRGRARRVRAARGRRAAGLALGHRSRAEGAPAARDRRSPSRRASTATSVRLDRGGARRRRSRAAPRSSSAASGPGSSGAAPTLGARRARRRGGGQRRGRARRAAGGGPRVSFGDERERHRGLSHHTRAALALCLGDVRVAWPRGPRAAGGRRRRRGRRGRLGARLRAAAALAHGPRAGRRPVVLRGGVRRRAARRRVALAAIEACGIVPRAVRIGVAREIKPQEYRVALTPAGALELVQRGHEVVVEHRRRDSGRASPTRRTRRSGRGSPRSTRSGPRPSSCSR